jgi:uncharacterized protein (DUF1501 family)
MRKNGMACILLFMGGGPSHLETWDPKPDVEAGGETKAIDTAVEGIRIAHYWPKVAQQTKNLAIIRSMTNTEGEHQRAQYMLHTGHAPAGGVRHPTFGTAVANEIAPENFDLPCCVSINQAPQGIPGSGILGPAVAPFVVADPNTMPANVVLPRGVNDARFARRLELLKQMDKDLADNVGKPGVEEHQTIYGAASRLVRSPNLKAFDLTQEKEAVRDRYGRTSFGQGCLLARRLVEAGVTYVAVYMNSWDTHRDHFSRMKRLAGDADPGFAALIEDLRDRGMLERTLVIWTGEFGRTPRINPSGGRDHYPKAFNLALAGAGIKGGQVIGATNADASVVKERPVRVPDLFCSFCHALRINPRKENQSDDGRPIKIVEGGEVVKELF